MARVRVNMDFVEMMERASPREVYGRRLAEVGAERPEIVALTADLLTSNKLDDFKQSFPDRFFNVGIAEANMMGIAAGMALDGKIPFVSTFATFASMRACEQVRTDIAYPNLPVKILATMSGLSGGTAGPTHASIEDLGIMRLMPNMTVVAPGDPLQMNQFIDRALEVPGPVYIRLGRGNDPVIYEEGQEIEIGRAIVAREGTDVAIVACGTVMTEALGAAAALEEAGISTRVVDCHTVRPLDAETVVAAALECGAVVTAEDHSVVGGLGSAVAEAIAHAGVRCRLRKLGVPDVFPLIGPPGKLYNHYGYDAQGIATAAQELLEGPREAAA